MKRNIQKAALKNYDLIIIGGGISGACVAWDAALRGLTCLLLEKKDFGNATSSATSKLIHGGLRYLKNFELSLVRESLSERRIFEIIAPHLVKPIPFMIPTYGHGMDSRLPLMAALTVYDVLGYDKKELEDREKRISNHHFISTEKALEIEPGLKKEGLSGAAIYHDCQMQTPDRLTLEFILSAHEYGAEVLNYFEVTGFIKSDNQVTGVIARDQFSGENYHFNGKVVVNVSGPWADLTLSILDGINKEKSIIRSKGIHIITRPLTREMAIVFKTASNRHFFIIPWRNHSLIGTTDTKYEGDPDNFKVTETDIIDFIAEINVAFPDANLKRNDVVYFYGGLRPIVDSDTEIDVYDASRRYEITDHKKTNNIKGLITVIGGKYTTSRKLAKHIVDLVYSKLKLKSPECQTDTTPLIGGHINNVNRFIDNAINKKKSKFSSKLIKHLILYYGSEYQKILKLIKQDSMLGEKICANQESVFAEFEHALQHEMALTLEDLLFRRTAVGTLGKLNDDNLKKCADFAASRLNWSEAKKDLEMLAVTEHYNTI